MPHGAEEGDEGSYRWVYRVVQERRGQLVTGGPIAIELLAAADRGWELRSSGWVDKPWSSGGGITSGRPGSSGGRATRGVRSAGGTPSSSGGGITMVARRACGILCRSCGARWDGSSDVWPFPRFARSVGNDSI